MVQIGSNSMEELAARMDSDGVRAAEWTNKRVVDALLVLRSYEAFETLVQRRGYSPQSAGDVLFALAQSFLAPAAPGAAP